ncbi:AfsR/SARP family transcriptional regulator [Nocardia bhagyanarayanae]|uniref:Putative ATPase n=1 Tax=Nocardia bhagyanarayanae TaxID=1215925 RepID=A0A543F940_9NOCA|nr:BTAD domain-containing putative transcriptional regulator [Nocardia bhagyanarayanae]TQM30280.1 putative ATPase [Nocardia bhagyanarayanae]
MSPDRRGPDGPNPTATPAGASVVVALLGEVAVRRDDGLTPVPGTRSRLLLTALALRPGRSRSAPALIEDVWAEQPPRSPMNALHTQVSRLRSALPDGALEMGPAGYRLTFAPDQVDLTLAGELLARARRDFAAADFAACLASVRTARALWRGEPAADLLPGDLATELSRTAGALATELDAVELTARESSGDIRGALELARRRCAADPLDEGAQLDLMRLLARADRTNEALESFAAFRVHLADQLGADPGRPLVELNTAILRGEVVGAAASTAFGGPAANSPARPAASRTPREAIGLRAAPNALLGRDADLDELVELLHAARVVTVLGPGGTGKTRVANEVGARVARREPVVLVELASVRSTSVADARTDIESAISTTLGIGEVVRDPGLLRPGRIDTGRPLRDALSARPMLLILDNCEHLIDAVAEVVADLIGSCDQLTVLTTSRAPLAISAESVYPLAPLAIDAAGSPATDLFCARARAVRPSVRLDPDAVARLCAMLDGLPLAIELAAARARTMSVEEIESRLEHRFALLRGGDRSSPERHRTLHAVIAWSWNLLDPPQQATLRRMCRFPAGFTLAAAEVVAGGSDVGDVAVAVDGLVGQSLLTVLEDEDGTRYRMLETVREFGEEQLTAVDEGELVMRRMSHWASEYAVASARRYRTDDQVGAVLSVAAELDNLTAVLRYALDRGDFGTVYRVFPVAAMLWMIRGAHLELTSWAPRVLRLTPERGPARGVVANLRMLTCVVIGLHMVYLNSDLRPLASVRARARALLRTAVDMNPGMRLLGGLLVADVSGKGVARKLAEGARSPDRDVRAAALIARANIRENAGDVHGSARDALGALRLVEPDDLWGTAMVCQHLGQLGGQRARYAESVDYYRRAVEALRTLRAHEEIVEIRSYLAVALIGIGRVDQARAELSFALGSSDDPAYLAPLDDPNVRRNHRLATVAAGVAELALAEGDIDSGIRYYRRSLDLLGWPEDDLTPGPGGLMLAGAMVGAHVLYGRVDAATELAAELAAGAAGRLAQFYDLPQIGAVACGVGSYLLAVDPGSDLGMELLALSAKVVARQDYPSMVVERHLELHRPRVGAERMSAALRSAAAMRRRIGAARIIALLREFSGMLDA